MGYVFISYSTKEQSSAEAMKNLLEKQGVQTWMAPGDIPAGSKYAQVINKAVRESSCFILMLSENSQNSVWVSKEVERAINYRKPIIPVQLENLVLNDEFELYISTDQVVAVKAIDENNAGVQKILNSAKAIVGKNEDINIKQTNKVLELSKNDSKEESQPKVCPVNVNSLKISETKYAKNKIKKCFIALGGIGCRILNHFEKSNNLENCLFVYYDTDLATKENLNLISGKFHLFENFSQGLAGVRKNGQNLLELSKFMDNNSDLYDVYKDSEFDETGIELVFVTTSFGGFGSGSVIDFQKIVKDEIRKNGYGDINNINTKIIAFSPTCFDFLFDTTLLKTYQQNSINFIQNYYDKYQNEPSIYDLSDVFIISQTKLSEDTMAEILMYDRKQLSLINSKDVYLSKIRESIKKVMFVCSNQSIDKNNDLTISNKYTAIYSSSFSHVFLNSLKIPSSVVRIQKDAFVSALIKEIHISKYNLFYALVTNELIGDTQLVDTISGEIINTGFAKLYEY